MNNNDVLRRVRYALNLSDPAMVVVFALSGVELTPEQVGPMLMPEDELGTVATTDDQLSGFLDGLIVHLRGPRAEGAPTPAPTAHLTNNAVFKKLRIALALHEEDVLGMLSQAGQPLSKHELTALFRKPGHKHYRACGDQVLRAFLKGLTQRKRPDDG